jgi:hypothetical protein
MKKYSVVAKGERMDAEFRTDDYCYDAVAVFNEFKESGEYTQVYIMDNHTGEIYRTYDVVEDEWGISISETARWMH